MKLLCWFWKFLGFKICVKVFQFLWWWILQRWIQNRKLQFLRLNKLRLQSWVLNLLYNAQNFVKKEEEGRSRFFFCIAELGYDAGATFCWFLYVGCKHELIWVLKCIMEYLKNQGFCVCVKVGEFYKIRRRWSLGEKLGKSLCEFQWLIIK